MSGRQATRWMILIVAVAVVLRAAAALVHPFWFPDSADYDLLGRAIAQGGPYQVNGLWATRMPGYPAFVGTVYAIGGTVRAVLLLQAVMGGMTTWLVYLIGRRVSVRVGLLAGGLAAVDPLSIGFSAAFLSESAFTVSMLTALWMLVRLMERPTFAQWIGVGVVWGTAVYMRASALWLIVPLVVWTGWRQFQVRAIPGKPGALWGMFVAVAIVFAAVLPWQARNFAMFHERFFRLTTLEGISLYEAVYPAADGGPKQDIIPLPAAMLEMNESERDNEWSRRAWAEVRSNPLRIAGLAARKIARTWSLWLNAAEFRNGMLSLAIALWHVPLFILAVVGMVARRMAWPMKGLWLMPIGYFTAVHALFLGSVRYRVPLMPLLCVFAAVGVSEIMKRRGLINVSAAAGSSNEKRVVSTVGSVSD